MALQQARLNAYKDLVECQFSDVEALDRSTNPTTLKFGSRIGQHYRGTVLGGLILNAGVMVLIVGGVSPIFGLVTKLRKGSRGDTTSERAETPKTPQQPQEGNTPKEKEVTDAFSTGADEALVVTHYPSALVIPFAFTLQGVLTSAVSLLRVRQDSTDIPLAVVGILLPITFIAFVAVKTISPVHFGCARGPQDDRPSNFERRWPLMTSFVKFFESEEQWVDLTSYEFKKRYVYFFDDYSVRWYLVIELIVSFLFGSVNGIRLNDYNSCKSQSVAILVISLALLVVSCVLRPLSTNPNNFFSIFANASGALCAVFGTINVFQESDTYSSVVDYISTVTMLVLGFKTCLDVVLLVLKTLRRRDKAEQMRRDSSIMKRRQGDNSPREMDPSRSQAFVLPVLEEEDAEALAHLEAKETEEEEAAAARKAEAFAMLSREGLTDLMEIDAFLEKAMKELEQNSSSSGIRRRDSQAKMEKENSSADPFGNPSGKVTALASTGTVAESKKQTNSTPTSPATPPTSNPQGGGRSPPMRAAQRVVASSSDDDDDLL